MKKVHLAVLLSVSFVASSAIAATFSLGDVVNGISKVINTQSATSDAASSSANAALSSEILVKDLPNLQKLTDKPFLRGLSKVDYAELERPYEKNLKNKNRYRMVYSGCQARNSIAELAKNYYKFPEYAAEFQADAMGEKPFYYSNKASVFSNPYAYQTSAFDLSKLNDFTRNNSQTVYKYSISTHFKIPDEMVKNGKFVFEEKNAPVKTYVRGGMACDPYDTGFAQLCYSTINGNFLSDSKGAYAVKKGNIVDYKLTCYFAGDDGKNFHSPINTIQDIQESNNILPTSWNVYAIPDPLAKDSGKSYKLTNRDMFLYENEVYPAK